MAWIYVISHESTSVASNQLFGPLYLAMRLSNIAHFTLHSKMGACLEQITTLCASPQDGTTVELTFSPTCQSECCEWTQTRSMENPAHESPTGCDAITDTV